MDKSNSSGRNWFRFFLPELKERISSLQVLSRLLVEGRFEGIHSSRQLGSNQAFREYRNYSPGDDIRKIDWKTYARSDRLYVRRFEKDSNLEVVFGVDLSGSMDYVGFPADRDGALDLPTKGEYAKVLVACLAYLFAREHDEVGLLMDHSSLRLTRGNEGFVRACEHLESAPVANQTTLFRRSHELMELKGAHKGLIIVVSDWYDDRSVIDAFLKAMAVSSIRLLAVQIRAPLEATLEINAPHRFEDLESDIRIAVNPNLIRRYYLEEMKAHNDWIRETCEKAGIPFHTALTSDPIESVAAAILACEHSGVRS